MSRVRGSVEIARPVEVVFDAVADQRHEPSYNPTMTESTKVTPGAIGVGTRFEATVLAWDWNVMVTGPARFAGPLIGLIGRRQERTIWTALKLYLEGTNEGSQQDGSQPS